MFTYEDTLFPDDFVATQPSVRIEYWRMLHDRRFWFVLTTVDYVHSTYTTAGLAVVDDFGELADIGSVSILRNKPKRV